MPEDAVLRYTIELVSPTQVRYHEPQCTVVEGALGSSGLHFETLLWLTRQLAEEGDDRPDPDLLRLLGSNLFEFLFSGQGDNVKEARKGFKTWCNTAQGGSEHSVQIKFDKQAQALVQLPWEFLYVEGCGFLAVGENLILTRYATVQPDLSQSQLPLKVLSVVESPDSLRADVRTDDLKALFARLTEAHGPLSFEAPPPEYNLDHQQLKARLEEYRPHILHFRGHGEHGALWLAGADDHVADQRRQRQKDPFRPIEVEEGVLTEAPAFDDLFSRHHPDLVILESCESALDREYLPAVASLLVAHIPAVIGMRFEIKQTDASVFVAELYDGIVKGVFLDRAVRNARMALRRARMGTPDQNWFHRRTFGTPVVYVRSSDRISNALPLVASGTPILTPAPGTRLGVNPVCPRCKNPGREDADDACEICGLFFRCPAVGGSVAGGGKCGTLIRKPIARPGGGTQFCSAGHEFEQRPWRDAGTEGLSLIHSEQPNADGFGG